MVRSVFFLVALFKTECLIGSLIYPEPLLFSLCGDILLDKDRALWQREREGVRKRNDRAMTREEKKKSLSTCSKTQCTVLKTVKGGIFLKCAKSRLQGIRDREMKAQGSRGNGG